MPSKFPVRHTIHKFTNHKEGISPLPKEKEPNNDLSGDTWIQAKTTAQNGITQVLQTCVRTSKKVKGYCNKFHKIFIWKLVSEDHAIFSFFPDPPLYRYFHPASRITYLLSDKDPTFVPVQTWGQSFYCLQLWSTDLLSFPAGPRYLAIRTFSLVNFKILNIDP